MMEAYSDIKALEHSTLKVPYEVLNKKYRITQKSIDREVSHISNATLELEAKIMDQNKQPEELVQLLGGLVDKLKTFKRKAEEGMEEEHHAAHLIKRRVERLQQPELRLERLDRFIVDYFLRNGYYESAVKLARHSDLEDITNIELFVVARDVEKSLLRQESASALAWCHDNKSKLRKLKSTFEFNLRTQEFIEMVKKGEKMEAIKHARKHFQTLENKDNYLKQIQSMMALLAFSPENAPSVNAPLFSEKRWQTLVQQFREENYAVYQLTNYSVFSVVVQAGLSSLKTAHCYKPELQGKNRDCPVCSKTLNSLAKHLPFSHSSRSRLVCYLSGEPLNELNPPLMLPNGFTYGENALLQMASENSGKLVCPRSKQSFDLKDAEKVYVM